MPKLYVQRKAPVCKGPDGPALRGVLDYANMRPSATPPCKDLALYYATTRSRRIDMHRGVDNIGILPNYVLPKDKDWIKEAVKYMDKK